MPVPTAAPTSALSENEEFEFRARLESEGGGAPVQPTQETDHPRLGPLASKVVRPIAQGVMALPNLLGDVGVDLGNLANKGLSKLGMKTYPGYQLPRPSEDFARQLDYFTTAPKDTTGKVTEAVESMMVGGPQSAEEKALVAMRKGAQMSGKQVALQTANQAGFKIPPSETGEKIGRAVQSLAGKPGVEESASLHNAKRAEALVKQELKLPDTAPLDDATFKAMYKNENSKFEAIKALPGKLDSSDAPAHQRFLDDIVAAGEHFRSLADEFKDPKFGPAVTPDIEKEMSITMQDSVSPAAAIDRIKQLRDLRNQHMRSGEAVDRMKGMVEGDLMKALIERVQAFADKSGQPEVAKQYREATVNLAKINAVHDSMIGTRISIPALAKIEGLTGNLKTITDMAHQFPKAFQDVQKRGERGPYSVVDFWVAMAGAGFGGGAGATHHYYSAGGAAAATLARPALRGALGSKAYQQWAARRLTQPKAPMSPFRGAAALRGVQSLAGTSSDVDQNTAGDVQ